MSPPRITFVVNEDHTILTPDITTIDVATRQRIDNIIKSAVEAAAIRKNREDEKSTKQSMIDRQMDSIKLIMLESPMGVTKVDILIAAQSVEFIATLTRFRAFLRRNNIYTLKKIIKNKQPFYALDPVR